MLSICSAYPNLNHAMHSWENVTGCKNGGFFWQEGREDKGLRGGGNQSIDEMDVCFPWGEGRMFPKQSPDNWVIEGFVGVVVIDAASKQEGILCWVDRKTSFIN